MKLQDRVYLALYAWWFEVRTFPGKIKRRIWNKHILLWWHRLWIRKDEFHCSLNMDTEAMLEMNGVETEKYLTDLLRRRMIAHRQDLVEC